VLAAVLDTLAAEGAPAGPMLLCGKGWGGGTVVHFALAWPQRVAAMVLLNPDAISDEVAPKVEKWRMPPCVAFVPIESQRYRARRTGTAGVRAMLSKAELAEPRAKETVVWPVARRLRHGGRMFDFHRKRRQTYPPGFPAEVVGTSGDVSQHLAPEITYEVARLLSGRDPLAPRSAADTVATLPATPAGQPAAAPAVAVAFGPGAGPGARTLAVGGADGTLRLWSVGAAPQLLREVRPHAAGPIALAAGPTTRAGWVLAVAAADGRVRWAGVEALEGGGEVPWRVGAEPESGRLHAGTARAVAVAGELVVGGADHRLRVWDRESCQLLLESNEHEGTVLAVAACHGKLATGGDDGSIRVYFDK
jgi:pimeloyl-ACP methyl ester carboxylesterase